MAEQLEPRRQRQLVGVAVPIDGEPVDVLHREVGRAVVGGAAVDQPRDVRVIEVGEDLPFGPEPLFDDRRLERRADHLDRDLLLVRIVGADAKVDGAHPAAADFAHQPVRADPPPGPPGCPLQLIDQGGRVGAGERRGDHEAARPVMRGDQRLELASQRSVAAARLGDERRARVDRLCERLV